MKLGNITYQIIRVTNTLTSSILNSSNITVLNNGLGEVLEIPTLQPALEMVAMLNENSNEGIKYKLRGVKIKSNK
tara:strand:- start:3 stop:227 length:225 start_codon:yes stop_codon:yes gene_type:complete